MRAALLLVTDLICVCLAGVALAILVTGGGTFPLAERTIAATRARNPLMVLLLLAALRFGLAPSVPFLRVSASGTPSEWSSRACRWLDAALADLTPARASRLLALGLVLSLAVKLGNAWYYGGFAWADSVEIHEMTFSALDGHDRRVWNVRGAFYPMVFVYPLQRLSWAAGVRDPAALVFTGRLAVVGFSLLNLWLVYRIGRKLFSPGVGLIAFAMLLASRLHVRLGSTELPRTVSSTLLLSCFWLLVSRRGVGWAGLAGLALGVAASLRFGEAVFVVPFAAQLAWERRYRELGTGLLGALLGAAAVLGPGDRLFWPEMFWSLRHMLDFALVKRLSSSGHDPLWQYLLITPAATDVITIAFFVYSLRFRPWRAALWCVAPLLLLSLFQKKEDRYLLPLLPFFLLCAAVGASQLLARCRDRAPGTRQILTLIALGGALLLEIEGFRLRDRGNAVKVFEALARDPSVRNVAMEDGVQAGARLYLPPGVAFWNLEGSRLEEGAYLWATLGRPEAQYLVLRETTARREPTPGLLASAGFMAVEVPGAASRDYRVFRRGN